MSVLDNGPRLSRNIAIGIGNINPTYVMKFKWHEPWNWYRRSEHLASASVEAKWLADFSKWVGAIGDLGAALEYYAYFLLTQADKTGANEKKYQSLTTHLTTFGNEWGRSGKSGAFPDQFNTRRADLDPAKSLDGLRNNSETIIHWW
jgi:hypothetical protein